MRLFQFAQSVEKSNDGTNTLYFQYDSFGTPIGFLYNGTQYFYLTDQMGDVTGIIDTAGNLIAEYIYDDWGRLSKIQTANDTKEEKDFAKANPLRYRGYYYDNETGYYYLQSRYYDPFTSRFINADSYSYINTDTKFSKNAYAYCENDPIAFSDPTGHSSEALGIAVFYIVMAGTGLLLAYYLICAVVIAISGIDAVSLPSLPSISSVPHASPTEMADANLREAIKKSKGVTYWAATRQGGYVVLGQPIDMRTAKTRIVSGKDVFAVSKSAAYKLAKESYYGYEPVGPETDKGKENKVGYYKHYHVHRRMYKSHVFFL